VSFPSFRRFVEESNDALAEIDGHARVLFVNRHWRYLVIGPGDNMSSSEGGAAVTAGPAVARPSVQATPSCRRPSHDLEGGSLGSWPHIAEALLRSQSEEVTFQTELPRRALPLLVSLIRMVPDPDPVRARLLVRIRPLHAGLAPTRDRFFTLIEQFPFAIGVHRDLRFLYVNGTAARYLGYGRPEELVGMPITGILHPDEIPLVRRRVGHMMRTGRPLPERETKLLRKDGTTVTAELGAFMIRDEDGLPSYVVVARDVSERRVLEEKLQQGQRMQAIGRMAGGIAHDFNNILAIVLTYAELLAESPDASDVAASASEIQRAAQRAAALVQQLLTFSRGHLSEPRVVKPNEAVHALLQFLRRSIDARVALQTELGEPLPTIRLGASHLEQILINLVINARDAMPDGGALVIRTSLAELVEPSPTGDDCDPLERAASGRRTVHTKASVLGVDAGPYVVLEVMDSGSGMDPETASRAFEPFFTTKSPGKGTGLGLSTVYGIVRQAGGACEIDSTPGRGTTVRIFWPVHAGPADVEERQSQSDALPPGLRVMLVEDDEAVRVLVARLLKGQGVVVYEARDAAGALRLQEQLQIRADPLPEILLTDVVMPQASGPQLARTLRGRQPGLPVVFMSGYADDNLEPEDLSGDATWFLQKPFSTQDLLKTLAQAVLKARA